MINVAVICEYNPFHLGHKKQIDCIRECFPGERVRIINIMSGNMVQRGDLACAQKYKRAEWAVDDGADLVLELPFPYSIGRAQDFAFGAVSLVNSLGDIDYLCFGSECGDVGRIKECASNLLDKGYCERLAELVRTDFNGSYASVRERLYYEYFGKELLVSPNDILAIEYTAALIRTRSHTEIMVIPRGNDYSASSSRKAIRDNDRSLYYGMVPQNVSAYFGEHKIIGLSDLDLFVPLYFSLTDPEGLKDYYEMNLDLASKLRTASQKADGVDQLVDIVSDKRYTRARVRRGVISALLHVDKAALKKAPSFTVLLASNNSGREYLYKKKCSVPIITRKADLPETDEARSSYETLLRADALYNRFLSRSMIEIIKKPYISL